MFIRNVMGIAHKIIVKNFEVLFSKSDASLDMNSTAPFIDIGLRIQNDAFVRFNIDPDNLKPLSFSIYVGLSNIGEDATQLISDMTRTSNAIIDTLRDISSHVVDKKELIIFSTDEYAITTAFTDIGFTDKDGKRSLLLHHGNKYSFITFDENGNAETKEVPVDELHTVIMDAAKDSTIDTYQDAGILYYVNWEHYRVEDDE